MRVPASRAPQTRMNPRGRYRCRAHDKQGTPWLRSVVVRLKVAKNPEADRVEAVRALLDSGKLDTTIEQFAPADEVPAPPHGFADGVPFSHDRWAKRHSS